MRAHINIHASTQKSNWQFSKFVVVVSRPGYIYVSMNCRGWSSYSFLGCTAQVCISVSFRFLRACGRLHIPNINLWRSELCYEIAWTRTGGRNMHTSCSRNKAESSYHQFMSPRLYPSLQCWNNLKILLYYSIANVLMRAQVPTRKDTSTVVHLVCLHFWNDVAQLSFVYRSSTRKWKP
jgi:hypothetical protein